jgi:glycosyltransferase involved in cell wall biosynthesis
MIRRGAASDRRPRVVVLCGTYPPAPGGGGVQAEYQVRALAALGVESIVLCRRAGIRDAPRRERSARVRILRFSEPRFDRRHRLLFGLKAAWWLLIHSGWDILHIHGFVLPALAPVWVARLRRRPILVKTGLLGVDGAPEDVRLGLAGRLLANAYRQCDAIVALSDALEASFHSDGRFRARIFRIPNGVDIERFRPVDRERREAARAALGLPPGALIVASVGQLVPRKNVVALVRAAGRVDRRPICVALAGEESPDPGERAELERAIGQLPDGVEVRRLGQVPPSRLAQLLSAADLFALVSRAEGMPNSLLEAMASGLACVASDIPGSRDVLADGGGILVPLDDEDALVEALDALAANAEERARLGREARRVIEQSYSLERVARRYVEVYETLLRRQMG